MGELITIILSILLLIKLLESTIPNSTS